MKTYVQAQGFEVWKSIVDGYKEPTIPPTNDNGKKLSLNNSKATNSLLNGLCDSIYTKVLHCSSAKEKVSEIETKRFLFMEIEDFDKEDIKEEYEEAEVDYQE
jgi:hypothetical protein